MREGRGRRPAGPAQALLVAAHLLGDEAGLHGEAGRGRWGCARGRGPALAFPIPGARCLVGGGRSRQHEER